MSGPARAPGTPPRVLTIAGSDSGGGAGIQADLKTMLAHGVHGMSVVTAVTAQNSVGVQGAWELPVEAVRAQLASVLSDIGVDAVKTGMLSSAAIVEAVAHDLAGLRVPLVVDPVSVTTHGDPLLADDAVVVLRRRLLPLATVVTPNVPELALLTGRPVTSTDELLAAARALLADGPRWVLAKGGHLAGDTSVDLLTDGDVVHELTAARVDTIHTHGTGCTLASAVASRLARGDDVPTAVAAAKQWLTEAIGAGYALGAGHGPVRHAWQWQDRQRP